METIDFTDLRLTNGDTLLDLGCGEGRHCISACLLENVTSIGIDRNLNDLGTTRSRFKEFENPDDGRTLALSASDGLALPFADDTFDKVICSEVLEHIPDYFSVLREIDRVLKVGGTLAVSVPRFFPEWVCWQLSDEYHAMEGGHIRIFNASHLQQDIESLGFVRYRKHWAHALHVPYWWLKCAFWKEEGEEDAAIVRAYHRFLVWDLMKRPWLTRALEWLLNPIMGKSVVMYFIKAAPRGSHAE